MTGPIELVAQVLQHPWVASLSGVSSKPLSPAVAKGAATTAAARRFRSLVHGIAAEQSLRPLPRGREHSKDDDEGTMHNWKARLQKQQDAASQSLGYRCDATYTVSHQSWLASRAHLPGFECSPFPHRMPADTYVVLECCTCCSPYTHQLC